MLTSTSCIHGNTEQELDFNCAYVAYTEKPLDSTLDLKKLDLRIYAPRPKTGAPNNHWGQAMPAPFRPDHYLAQTSKIKTKIWPKMAEMA